MESKVGLREKIVIGTLALLLIAGGMWRALQPTLSAPEIIETGIAETENGTAEPELITVHLVGAVKSPGVYRLSQGSRVYELIEIAGGLASDAQGEALNQARPLLDGEQVFVPGIGETPAPSSAVGAVSEKVNINTADAAELSRLPGIGEVRAGQIVAHREKNGLFRDPREIMDVSGIGEKTYANIEDLVTIY